MVKFPSQATHLGMKTPHPGSQKSETIDLRLRFIIQKVFGILKNYIIIIMRFYDSSWGEMYPKSSKLIPNTDSWNTGDILACSLSN